MLNTNNMNNEAFSEERKAVRLRVTFNGNQTVTRDEIISAKLTENLADSNTTLGAAFSQSFELTMRMPETKVLLTGAYFTAEAGFDGTEWVPLGTFYVLSVSTDNNYKTVTITASDRMALLTDTYTPGIDFPASQREVIEDIANQYSLAIGSIDFADTTITKAYEGTVREYLGWLAGLSGANARIDRNGKLSFAWYNQVFELYGDANLDGKINSEDISYIEQHLQGTASTKEAEAILGRMIVSKAYIGAELTDPVRAVLADVNEDGIVDVKDAAEIRDYIDGTPQSPTIVGTKKYAQTLNEDSIEEKGFALVGTETCTISALISGTEENPVESGSGKAINFYNPLIDQDTLDTVAARILPFAYLAAEVTYRGCPSWEAGDIIRVNGSWNVPIMNQVMEFGAKLSATAKSFGLSDEEATAISAMPDVKEVQRQLPGIKQMITDINQSLLSGDTGYMILDEVEIDGVKRLSGFKLMDTPTITDATKGWLANKNGIGWSSDGFKTISKLGLDMANGKIYADQIAAGTIITNSFKIGKSDTEYAMSFDGTTGEITFGSGVAIAWGDITDAPSIPTKTSELTNDSDYATTEDIPTKTSQLTNDSDYATTDDIPDTSNFIRKYGTYITDTAIWSGSLTANNLTVTGGSININTGAKNNSLVQLNYVYDSYGTHAYTKVSPLGLEIYDDVGSYSGPSILYVQSGAITMISSGGRVSINTNNEHHVGIVEANEFHIGNQDIYSIFATMSDLSDYALATHTHSAYYSAGDNIYANKLYVQNAGTVSGSANARLAASSPYQLGYASGSSMWYKHDIKPVENEELDPHHLYDIKIYQFKYNDDYLSESDQRYGIDCIGFIAEQVNNVYPIAADLETGKPRNWEMRYIIPPMLALIQEQKKEIDELKERVNILET